MNTCVLPQKLPLNFHSRWRLNSKSRSQCRCLKSGNLEVQSTWRRRKVICKSVAIASPEVCVITVDFEKCARKHLVKSWRKWHKSAANHFKGESWNIKLQRLRNTFPKVWGFQESSIFLIMTNYVSKQGSLFSEHG